MPVKSESPDADIFEMVARGDRVYAVAAYRARYHVSIGDAEAAVAAMGAIVAGANAPARAPAVAPPAPTGGPLAAAPDARDAEVRAMLARGNKIEAIKIYRETHGVGLREAKDAVEAIEASGVASVQPTASAPAGPSQLEGAWPQIDALIRAGQTISAIKLYREATGAGLAESKHAVDARIAQLFPPR